MLNETFRPGEIFTVKFFLGVASFGTFRVLTGLKVFWDIPSESKVGKGRNLKCIAVKNRPAEERLLLLCLLLFILFQSISFAQLQPMASRYIFEKQLTGDTSAKSVRKFSSATSLEFYARKDLEKYLNNGYPFARLTFDTLVYSGESLLFRTSLDAGPMVRNGTIVNNGQGEISIKLLRKMARFREGDAFSLQRFVAFRRNLNQFGFCRISDKPWIEWFGNQAILHLSTFPAKSNAFAGILGLLPKPDGQKGVLVTGNIDGKIQNLFGAGASLDIKWNRFAPASQSADVQIAMPFIGYQGFGVDTKLEIFRQDSLFSRQRFELNALQANQNSWTFKLGTLVSSANTKAFGTENQAISSSIRSLKFAGNYQNYPASILSFEKRILNFSIAPSLKKLGFSNGLQSTLPQLDFSASGSAPLLIQRRFGLLGAFQSGSVLSRQLIVPDQFRVGGIKSIRGFLENQFFVSHFAIASLRPSYLLDKDLMAGIFTEVLASNSQLTTPDLSNLDLFWSAGFSLELALSQNLVQIYLANGFGKNLPFDAAAFKIHFGYVARF